MSTGLGIPHLNYTTHAIEGLTELVPRLERMRLSEAARNVRRVIELLGQSVKFILPDNGVLFDDGLRALPEVFHLPYPVTVAEFQITQDAPESHQPLAQQGAVLHGSSRRIALAIEITASNFQMYEWMLPIEKFDLLTRDGSIAIISVYYVDADRQWMIPPFGVVIPARKKAERPADLLANSMEMYGGAVPKGMEVLPLEMHPTFLLPEQCMDILRTGGLPKALATAAQDNGDERHAITALIEVLSCKNVLTNETPPPAPLNKKRLAKGKPPFFEYKTLLLDPSEASSPTATLGGTHASPRVHLRRGHIRRLPNRNIWVNAAVVGNRQSGMVLKDYAVIGSR